MSITPFINTLHEDMHITLMKYCEVKIYIYIYYLYMVGSRENMIIFTLGDSETDDAYTLVFKIEGVKVILFFTITKG